MTFDEHAQDGRGVKRPAARVGEFLSSLAARSRALCAWERGSGLVEFTLLILVLMLLALGVFDFGIVIQRGMAISAAVRAGAEFGAADGNANNTAGMISAAQSAAPTISSLHVSAATWCACTPNGTTVSCGSLCNTYDLPIQYVQVNAGASAPVMFRFPGIPRYISLAGSSTLRAR